MSVLDNMAISLEELQSYGLIADLDRTSTPDGKHFVKPRLVLIDTETGDQKFYPFNINGWNTMLREVDAIKRKKM